MISERLNLDERKRPFKIMGLRASYGLMKTIYTGIVTIGFTVIQKLISS